MTLAATLIDCGSMNKNAATATTARTTATTNQ